MTTREYYARMTQLQYEYDFRGILNLMGEEYGKLEGDFTFAEVNQLRLIRNWAKRLVEPEEYAAILDRVNARIDERLAREGNLHVDDDPNAPPRPYRFWAASEE